MELLLTITYVSLDQLLNYHARILPRNPGFLLLSEIDNPPLTTKRETLHGGCRCLFEYISCPKEVEENMCKRRFSRRVHFWHF